MHNYSRKKACPEQGRRVYVGLSGGVDSAVSAALLKKEGYDVTGVFIKGWQPPSTLAPRSLGGVGCVWRDDRRSAMRAAAILDIPFITLDLSQEYKKEVADYMIEEYKKGRTPNPDVMCNKAIKFGHFLKFALDNGADFVATGHYARRYENHTKAAKGYENFSENRVGSHPSLKIREGLGMSYELKEGKDKSKDQSYFLWTLTQDQLKHILFPVGHLQKSEVRMLAKKFKLPQATRKDSQGLCFLGQIDMKDFLADYIKTERGDVFNESGEVIGYHPGALLFTLGERHGFTVTKKGTGDKPLYVIEKDIDKNTITVSEKLKTKSASWRTKIKTIHIKNVNWIGEIPDIGCPILCRYRYRQEKIEGKIERLKPACRQGRDGKIEFQFKKPQEAVAPGQSLVFYDACPNRKGRGEVCLGGGVVE